MFSATNAAFEGFRLAGRRPFLMLFWAAAYTVAILGLVATMLLILAPPDTWRALFAGDTDALEKAAFNPVRFMVAFPLVCVGVLVLTAMSRTAVFRAILRPKTRGLGYLAIGGDEGRQILLSLLIMLVTLTGMIGALALGAMALRLTPEPYRVLAGVLAGAATVALGIWIATRLSLAAVQTFVERRVTLFGSWRLTRGRFWPLLGMWLLVFVLVMVASLVATGASYLPVLFSGAAPLSIDLRAGRVPAMPLETAALVGAALQSLIQMIGAILQAVVGIAPGAAAYDQLKGSTT